MNEKTIRQKTHQNGAEPVEQVPPSEPPSETSPNKPEPNKPVKNPIMAKAIDRVTAVLQGRGVTSNPALLLGQSHLRIAQLEEALQVAIDALAEIVPKAEAET